MSPAESAHALRERLFREAPGSGAPDGPGWVTGEAAEPLSATRVRWYLRGAAGRIEAARYEVRGCPYTIAAAALIAAELPGARAGARLDLEAIAERIGAPADRMGRFFVIQDALRAASLLLAAAPA